MAQTETILSHLLKWGTIDPIQAKEYYGIMRLAARINELRSAIEIKTVMVQGANRFGDTVHYARYEINRPI